MYGRDENRVVLKRTKVTCEINIKWNDVKKTAHKRFYNQLMDPDKANSYERVLWCNWSRIEPKTNSHPSAPLSFNYFYPIVKSRRTLKADN